MRVALIGPVTPELGGATPGGVATHQVQLARGLAEVGIAAPLLATNSYAPHPSEWLVCAGGAPFPMYRMVRAALDSPVYWSTVGLAPALRYGLQAFSRHRGSRLERLGNLLWYRRFLAEARPDVIHVQHPLERALYARTVRDAERWRTPIVVTAHSLFGEHADATIHGLMAPNLRAADGVIAVSEHIADQAVSLGVALERVRVIRSGVDTSRFQPRDRPAARARLGISDETRMVLFVGNLEPRKQVDVLLRAAAQLRERVPDLLVLIVGSGESAGQLDQTQTLRSLVRELSLAEFVRFAGRLSDAQLMDAYAAADVFALPSSSEAQGIVALEAMACGLPVVASAVGGLLGTIEDGLNGWLVPAGDVDALADRLAAVLCNPALSREVGTQARRAVEANFTWQRAIEATLRVYEEVVR